VRSGNRDWCALAREVEDGVGLPPRTPWTRAGRRGSERVCGDIERALAQSRKHHERRVELDARGRHRPVDAALLAAAPSPCDACQSGETAAKKKER